METTIALTESLFATIHAATFTPWYLTIPLLALTMNLFARLPLSLYARRIAIRRARLLPLFLAWRGRISRGISADPDLGPSAEKRDAEYSRQMKATSKRIYREWRVQRWRDFLPVAAFPVWLTGIEALRRMCGGPRGLIGTALYGPGKEGEGEGVGVTALGEGTAGGSGVEGIGGVGAEDVLAAVPTGADMSLSTEGCLWFPDLMMPDPLHILPFALSAVMVINVMPKEGKLAVLGVENPIVGARPGMARRPVRLTRSLLVLSVMIGPLTMGLPAALHLYWLSSATITLIQTQLISHFMPLPKLGLEPCKGDEMGFIRPTRGKLGDTVVKE